VSLLAGDQMTRKDFCSRLEVFATTKENKSFQLMF